MTCLNNPNGQTPLGIMKMTRYFSRDYTYQTATPFYDLTQTCIKEI